MHTNTMLYIHIHKHQVVIQPNCNQSLPHCNSILPSGRCFQVSLQIVEKGIMNMFNFCTIDANNTTL